jgi:hypothetical protein
MRVDLAPLTEALAGVKESIHEAMSGDYRCPKCHGTEDLEVAGVAYLRCKIDQDGNVVDYTVGDIEYDGNSAAYCNNCDFDGDLREFVRLEDDDEQAA